MRPGAASHEVDRPAATSSPTPAGATFVHGTGHGVGLDIHEAPRVGPAAPRLRSTAGHVVTVEPGVYLPDLGGVRIEDTVLVTDEGCASADPSPKTPLVV